MAKSKKYYVVWAGKNTGVFSSWGECQLSIVGFSGAKYKSFSSLEEANKAYGEDWEDYYKSAKNSGSSKVSLVPKEIRDKVDNFKKNGVKASGSKVKDEPSVKSVKKYPSHIEGWAVDAACSGNPGDMEYRGVDILTGKQLFRSPVYKRGTNNIGEFLAIVHALALQKKKNLKINIYSDSKIAIGWIKKKKCNTKLAKTKANYILFDLISRGENWLKENEVETSIIKWETKVYGEIPADFGRK